MYGPQIALTFTVRFVDRDMFMRYRGGGIGHKYMREVEAKHENMSLKRSHCGSPPKPSPRKDDTDACGPSGGGERPGPGAGGGRSDGDESDDEDYVPPETDGSDEGDSTDSGEDSDNSSKSDGSVDSDEIESDNGFDSYGLADP